MTYIIYSTYYYFYNYYYYLLLLFSLPVLLTRCIHLQSVPQVNTAVIPAEIPLSQEDKELLYIYHSSFNDDKTNVDLLMALLIQIHCNQPKGEGFLINIVLYFNC